MAGILNQELGFDEVRWATMRKTSYDAGKSFEGAARKSLLAAGTRLYRLLSLPNGRYFEAVWWMPEHVFLELHNDADQSSSGSGRLFRNYVAQYMALPGSGQLAIVEIELIRSVYAWVGRSSSLFKRPGGAEQVYLPNLPYQGSPRTSMHARVLRTYWLKF